MVVALTFLDCTADAKGTEIAEITKRDPRWRWVATQGFERLIVLTLPGENEERSEVVAQLEALGSIAEVEVHLVPLGTEISTLQRHQILAQEVAALAAEWPGVEFVTLLREEQRTWLETCLALRREDQWPAGIFVVRDGLSLSSDAEAVAADSAGDKPPLFPEVLRAEQTARPLLDEVARRLGLVGNHPAFLRTLEGAKVVAETDRPVLLVGEPGAGKGLVAELIHRMGRRRQARFSMLHCGRLPAAYVPLALFGAKEKSQPGIERDHLGRLVTAGEGTFFLNGLDSVSRPLQRRLLMAMTRGTFISDGMEEAQPLRARLIFGVQHTLHVLLERELIDPDLAEWLQPNCLTIAPLRDRPSDIVYHALDILRRVNRSLEEPRQFDRESFAFLERQPWPRNLEDLRITVERAS